MYYLITVVAVLAVLAGPARAQELYGLGGLVQGTGHGDSSTSWQLDYRQTLNEHVAASVGYLNEGHISSHHRDGQTAQLWLGTRLADGRLSLSIGIGPYLYYDTVPTSQGVRYANNHGWGLNSSLAATWQTDSRWLLHMRSNWVETDSPLDTVSVLFGVGYRLDSPAESSPAAGRDTQRPPAKTGEMVAYLGRTIVNSFDSEHSVAVGVEYRHLLTEYLEGSVGWLYEGDSRLVRRNGITGEIWIVRSFFDDCLGLGIGAGLYFNLDSYHHAVDPDNTRKTVSGMVSLTGAYRLTPEWELRGVWHRIVTNYDRDTDVLLGGIGYRF